MISGPLHSASAARRQNALRSPCAEQHFGNPAASHHSRKLSLKWLAPNGLLNGDDLRRDPLEVRKATLASIVAKARPGIRFNEHIEGDGPTVFAHACKMSARTPPTVQAARRIGSSRRTRPARP